jgi:DNA polymerase-3 subunit delta
MEQNVFLFHGSDTFIIKSKIKNLVNKYDVDDFNVTTYDMEETSIKDAINDAETIPFMSEKKIVIIKNAYFLSPQKPPKDIDTNFDVLKRYLDNPVKETILVISAPYPKLDERKAITKAVMQKAEVTVCNPLKQADSGNWIKKQLGKNNISIDQSALNEMLKRVENNTEVLVSETQKLLHYATGYDHVDLDMVKKVITKNVEDNVYEITNMILDNKPGKALEIYNDLVMHSEDPLRILGILVNKYREILHVKELLREGKDQSDVARYYNASSGRAYYMVKNAQSVKMDTVVKHLKKLEEYDYMIKSGQIDKRIGIELFILST